MDKFLHQIRGWLDQGPPVASAPFEVVCRCGAVCRGQRLPQHQEVRCTECQRLVFVLPRSPLGMSDASVARLVHPRKSWPVWLAPVIAGSLTLLVCVGLYFLLLHSLVQDSRPSGSTDLRASLLERIAASRAALDRADLAAAQKELTAARIALQQDPLLLSAAETQRLNQLAGEVGVAATWPNETLDLIVNRGSKLREEEWQRFVAAYVGRGMVFDVVVRRDAAGMYQCTFSRQAANQLLRLQLQNQELLKYLPLNESQRLLLGARLAELRRDDQGLVQVRLEPDSAVLLTEPAVLNAFKTAIDPAGMAELAELQRRWVSDLPDRHRP